MNSIFSVSKYLQRKCIHVVFAWPIGIVYAIDIQKSWYSQIKNRKKKETEDRNHFDIQSVHTHCVCAVHVTHWHFAQTEFEQQTEWLIVLHLLQWKSTYCFLYAMLTPRISWIRFRLKIILFQKMILFFSSFLLLFCNEKEWHEWMNSTVI